MQIPYPEFLIPYIKGRNEEYVFLSRASRLLCLRNVVVEIKCSKQLPTLVRKLNGVKHPRLFLSCKVSHGRLEVIVPCFNFSKHRSTVACHFHSFTSLPVFAEQLGEEERLQSDFPAGSQCWHTSGLKIREDKSIQETAVSQYLTV